MFTEVASQPGSRPASPAPSATIIKSPSVMTADGHSMAAVEPSAGPEAKITFDIRATSAKVQEKYTNVLASQTEHQDLSKTAETKWKEAPFYDFKGRAKLYTAHLKAQAKFNLYKSDTLIQKFHIDYLEALSKSSLSPKEKHEKYAQFQKQAKAAADLKYDVYTLESCTSGIIKDIDSQKSDAISAALNAEQVVRNLLKEIQQPHTELRNNIAANLHYRDVQLRNTAKTEDERATLKSDISVIRSFEAAGGLTSLSEEESKNLNTLFKDATIKYNTFQKKATAFKKATSTTNTTSLHEASLAFQQADAAVIAKIRELSVNLKVPPQLRKDLTAHLKHKEALQASATGDEAAKLNEEIATLKVFLDSRQLAALNSETAAPLTTFFREADKQYASWKNLETAAKALDAAAETATDEPSEPQPKDDPKAQTKEEEAQTKAKQVKMEANKVLVDKARQARQAADAARTVSEEADADVMNTIGTLLYPPPPPPIAQPTLSERLGPPLVTVDSAVSNAVFAKPAPSYQPPQGPPPGPPPKPSSGPLPLTAFSSPASVASAFFDLSVPTQPLEENLDSLDKSGLPIGSPP